MKRVLLCAALLTALVACSDDKGSSSSSSSSGSSSSSCGSKRGSQKDDPAKCSPAKDDDAKAEADKEDSVTDTTKPAKEEPVAERGFKESKQPEGDSLDGKEMGANQLYDSGERLKVSNLGFSFVVPKGEKAYFQDGGGMISVGAQGADAKFLTLVVARTGVSEAEARDMLNQPWDLGNGDQLKRSTEIEKKGDRIACAVSTLRMVGYVEMLIGKSTGVAIATLGLPGSEKECKSHAGGIADGIKFATPAGEKQRKEYESQLMGKCAHVFKYKSGGGGASGSSWSSETNKYWHFGSDRSYEYFYQHTGASSFNNPSAEGGHAADTNSNHAGTWSIELTLGLPALILRTNDGRIITHVLNRSATHLMIDGDEAMIKASDRKR